MAKRERQITSEDVEKRIVPVSEADPYVKILIYGRNGSGKTQFASTAPNVLIIDIDEKGTRSARHSGAHVYPARNWSEVVATYWYLKEGNHKFKSVALDTLTTMNAMCLTRVLKEGVSRDPNKDPQMPRRQDYGKAAKMMREMLLAFRNLPMHVIFIAQEKHIGDVEEGEEVQIVPDLSGAPRGAAMGAVEVIGRMYRARAPRKKGSKKAPVWESRVLFGDHESYETKDRTLVLDRIMRNPTVPKIIQAAFNGHDEKE